MFYFLLSYVAFFCVLLTVHRDACVQNEPIYFKN